MTAQRYHRVADVVSRTKSGTVHEGGVWSYYLLDRSNVIWLFTNFLYFVEERAVLLDEDGVVLSWTSIFQRFVLLPFGRLLAYPTASIHWPTSLRSVSVHHLVGPARSGPGGQVLEGDLLVVRLLATNYALHSEIDFFNKEPSERLFVSYASVLYG